MATIVRTAVRSKTLTHVLLAGHNQLSPPTEYSSRSLQTPSNPSLTLVPFPLWIGSIGRADDVENGFTILNISSGLGHTLISYESEGIGRVFASGRNELGQLGVGFNSQEGTRGLVEGFEGEAVRGVGTGVQSSYMVMREGAETKLYVMGSLQRGRLGSPSAYSPNVEEEQDPKLHQLSKATLVDLPPAVGTLRGMANGFEHSLLLTIKSEVYGSGVNTDGQIGQADMTKDFYEYQKMELPSEVNKVGIAGIRASADTSGLVTNDGKLWTWGNSEHGQAFHSKKIDQIAVPTLVETANWLPADRRIIDWRCGGSFSVVIDSKGSIYTAGFGALGHGEGIENLEAVEPRRVERLEGEGITRIRAGWGWAIAIRDDGNDSAIFTWGLNSLDGRLGLGSIPSTTSPIDPRLLIPADKRSLKGMRDSSSVETPMRIFEPQQVEIPLESLGLEGIEGVGKDGWVRWKLGEVEGGEESMWACIIQESDVSRVPGRVGEY